LVGGVVVIRWLVVCVTTAMHVTETFFKMQAAQSVRLSLVPSW
jgi:hypothetical protein